MSEIGWNARNIRAIIDHLHRKRIAVAFLKLGGLESIDERRQKSFVVKIIIAIYSELVQEEKRLLSERIRSGLDEARRKGKKIGRPIGRDKVEDLTGKYSKLITDPVKGNSLTECCKMHVVRRNTVIKVRRVVRM